MHSDTTSTSKTEHWRAKYFTQLEEQEHETAELQQSIAQLRRSLLSLSIAAEGMDGELDHRLTELRERLHKQDSSDGLTLCLEAVENRLNDCEEKLARQVTHIKKILMTWCDEICANTSPTQALFDSQLGQVRELRRHIKKYPDCSASAFPMLNCLVAFSELKQQLSDPEQESKPIETPAQRPGLWARLFASRSEGQLSTVEQAKQQTEKFSVPAAPDLAPLLHDFVGDLMQSITQPDALALSSEHLRKNLQTEDLEELASQLKQASSLLDFARAHDQQELRKFLGRVAHSIETLQGFLDHSKTNQTNARKLDEGLDQELRHRMSSIHNDITQQNNLDELKASVQSQLDSMVNALEESSEQKRQIANGYSQQMSVMADRINAMENESRLMRESLQRHQEAMQLDTLTQVNNLGAFNARLSDEIKVWQATGEPLTVCIANIDGFSEVNDKFGHSAGDRALALIAKEISAELKQGDFLARYGGDEFVLLKPATSAESSLAAVKDIADILRRCNFRHKDEHFQLTLSFGVTEFQEQDSTDEVMDRAARALKMAKDEGRDCARVL